MTPEFVLGFIAGEGCFTTTCSVSDDAKYGVYPSMQFKLNVKEKKVLDEIAEYVGVGQITKECDKKGQWAWRITQHGKLEEFANWIENNSDCGFEKTKKYKSFKLWKKLLEDRKKLLNSKNGVKKFIRRSREINDKSARTTAKSINELEEIVNSSTNYICGVESTYSECCKNPVDSPDETCYQH